MAPPETPQPAQKQGKVEGLNPGWRRGDRWILRGWQQRRGGPAFNLTSPHELLSTQGRCSHLGASRFS
jgi:hypothetical protein